MFRVTAPVVCAAALLLASTPSMVAADAAKELVVAAKNEGQLTTIALPHGWCGYGALLQGFREKYGIAINELDPNARSPEEMEAIRASKGDSGVMAPDVIDVGFPYGPLAKAEGLIQPYRVETWDSIPDGLKDAEGYWYGGYFGVLSFEVNSDIVSAPPQDWADLLNEDYRNSIALGGDPRTSNQGVLAVYAAGLSRSGAPGAEAGEEGLAFFQELNAKGNLVPVVGKTASLAQGATPIIIRWDYHALADRDALQGTADVEVVVPRSAVVAGAYVQAISAYAPHPNAAKLWMEYLYSDEGQLGWLKGYCRPARFNDLVRRGKVPAELLDKLPPAEAYESALFPNKDDQAAAAEIIAKQWDSVVGVSLE